MNSTPATWRAVVSDVKTVDNTPVAGTPASVPGTPGSSIRFSAVPAAPSTTRVTMPLSVPTVSVPQSNRSPSPSRRSPTPSRRTMVGEIKLADPAPGSSISSVPGTPGSSIRFSAVPAATSTTRVTMPLLASNRSVPQSARSPSPSRRSPSPGRRAASPRPESPNPPTPRLDHVPAARVLGYVEGNSTLQSVLAGMQKQFQELAVAFVEERRARQQMEFQLQTQLQSVQTQLQSVVADVAACKEKSAALESVVLEDHHLRQQMQVQFEHQIQRLTKEAAEERHQRQQTQANFKAQLQGMQAAVEEERREREEIDSQLSNQVQVFMAECDTLKLRLHKIEIPQDALSKLAQGNPRLSQETGQAKLPRRQALPKSSQLMPKTILEEPDAEVRDALVADSTRRDRTGQSWKVTKETN